ncbi:hypothetical protein GUITHDRAFT_140914 [Guillardia theta CCMP2712]|uniref:Sfi1 spindle body domain-containing protein n=1 Tax=Guillardia theta (strain CCMP2712) TaxID=905079 RepID=L1J2K1_GUITC|nr:hypothetical protein GUITHDRAFT_140914 [Guillardia theta CCMP2712]EKX42751.1 hypothetical protein GUITHDRAFT_140914 [Guillardia theta CCMP2712]|eukprot:XP_005829731.1 hypothetical protein GUITHDRAFT_140914 [Guillardia theta CCMP2712]
MSFLVQGQQRWDSTVLIETEISRLKWFASRKTAYAVLAAWCSAIQEHRGVSEGSCYKREGTRLGAQGLKRVWRWWVLLVNLGIFHSARRYARTKETWRSWREAILSKDGRLTLLVLHKADQSLQRLRRAIAEHSSIRNLLSSQWLLLQNFRTLSLQHRVLPPPQTSLHIQHNLIKMVEAEAFNGYVGAHRYPVVSALHKAELVLPSLYASRAMFQWKDKIISVKLRQSRREATQRLCERLSRLSLAHAWCAWNRFCEKKHRQSSLASHVALQAKTMRGWKKRVKEREEERIRDSLQKRRCFSCWRYSCCSRRLKILERRIAQRHCLVLCDQTLRDWKQVHRRSQLSARLSKSLGLTCLLFWFRRWLLHRICHLMSEKILTDRAVEEAKRKQARHRLNTVMLLWKLQVYQQVLRSPPPPAFSVFKSFSLVALLLSHLSVGQICRARGLMFGAPPAWYKDPALARQASLTYVHAMRLMIEMRRVLHALMLRARQAGVLARLVARSYDRRKRERSRAAMERWKKRGAAHSSLTVRQVRISTRWERTRLVSSFFAWRSLACSRSASVAFLLLVMQQVWRRTSRQRMTKVVEEWRLLADTHQAAARLQVNSRNRRYKTSFHALHACCLARKEHKVLTRRFDVARRLRLSKSVLTAWSHSFSSLRSRKTLMLQALKRRKSLAKRAVAMWSAHSRRRREATSEAADVEQEMVVDSSQAMAASDTCDQEDGRDCEPETSRSSSAIEQADASRVALDMPQCGAAATSDAMDGNRGEDEKREVGELESLDEDKAKTATLPRVPFEAGGTSQKQDNNH